MEIKLKSWTIFNFIDEVKMKQLKKVFPLVNWQKDEMTMLEETGKVLTEDQDFENKFDNLSVEDSMEFIESYGKYLEKVISGDKKKSVK